MNTTLNLSIGDVLVREKAFGLINHVGVVVASNAVLQNTPERGEHVSTLQEFAGRAAIKLQRTGANPWHVTERARRILANAKQYNPFSRNCEHTVSEAVHGDARSPQLSGWLLLGGIAFLFWLASRR